MKHEEVIEGVKEIFFEVFRELENKEFDIERKQDQFENWDSFTHIDLVSRIEQKFNISLTVDEVVELDTTKKFIDIVEKKII